MRRDQEGVQQEDPGYHQPAQRQRLGELLDGETSRMIRSAVDNSVMVRAGHKFKPDFFDEFRYRQRDRAGRVLRRRRDQQAG